MSKLDEKLAASVKPLGRKPVPAKESPAAMAKKTTAAPKTKPAQPGERSGTRPKATPATDLNGPSAPLFPTRIWPD